LTSINWARYASPVSFFPLAGRLARWFGQAAAVLAAVGLWLGLVVAPTDAQQGEAYRIIFIHVPAAWMSMFIYAVMAGWCAVSLSLNARLSAMMAQALAPTGALFTVIALWSGSLWGRPAWGTYWAWDARMTSELILLFLYFGYMALRHAIDDPRRAESAGHLLLGEVVEYAASGCERESHLGAEDGGDHARGDAGDGLCGLVLRYRGHADPRAGDHSRARASRGLGR
jgi:heme exporter protein C